MRKIKAISNQSLFDIALQELGTPEAAFDLAVLNGVSVTEPPLEVKITMGQPLGFVVATLGSSEGIMGFNFTPEFYQNQSSDFSVIASQSLFDISVQESGTIESAFDHAIKNNISITELLEPKSLFKISHQTIDQDIADYFKAREFKVATLRTEYPTIINIWELPGMLPYSL